MTFGRDNESFCVGLSNGERGRGAYDELASYADSVERALCLAGFEAARIAKGIGRYPILIHAGRRAFWIVANDASDSRAYRAVYNATPSALDKPGNESGYHCLRGLFSIKGEPQSRSPRP